MVGNKVKEEKPDVATNVPCEENARLSFGATRLTVRLCLLPVMIQLQTVFCFHVVRWIKARNEPRRVLSSFRKLRGCGEPRSADVVLFRHRKEQRTVLRLSKMRRAIAQSIYGMSDAWAFQLVGSRSSGSRKISPSGEFALRLY